MNTYEEELQRKLLACANREAGDEISANNPDAKAYQEVFHALNKEPEYTLPVMFADRVIQKLTQRQKESPWLFFWFGFGVFSLILALVAAVAIAVVFGDFKPGLGFLNPLSDYKGLLFCATILIVIFNWLDGKLINKHLHDVKPSGS